MLPTLWRMSDKADSEKPRDKVGFECAPEVAALLNCVTSKNYNELKCIPLLKKLRACIEKKVSICIQLQALHAKLCVEPDCSKLAPAPSDVC